MTQENIKDRWWSDVLEEFIVSDEHTVELTEADPYGVQVVIDGTPMFAGEGYPWETFTIAELREIWRILSEDGREKLLSLESENQQKAASRE